VATGSSQDERIFTGYSQVPQQKKRTVFDMDRKWLKEREKGKMNMQVKGWQSVQPGFCNGRTLTGLDGSPGW
jgi:hypothetical protein